MNKIVEKLGGGKMTPDDRVAWRSLLEDWISDPLRTKWPRFNNPPQVECDCVAVAGDFHIPLTSEIYVSRLIRKASEHKAEELFIPGDFYNFDSASTYDTFIEMPSLDEEREIGEKLLRVLLKVFKKVHILAGNHDLRPLKRWNSVLKKPMSWKSIASDFFPGAVVYDYPYQYAILNGQTRITHPRNYSSIPARVAARLAAEKLDMNVVSFHGHLAGIVQDISGKFWAADPGLMADQEKFAYRQFQDSLFPDWTNGFAIIENFKGKDYPFLYNSLWTKWEE